MNEELLRSQIKRVEDSLIIILKDINNRLNKLENDVDDLIEELNGGNYERRN